MIISNLITTSKPKAGGGAPPAGWTPASLSNIVFWWNTGAGVTESGGGITAWEDQINGAVLTTQSGTPMTYTASDAQFNNEPSIYQDGTKATLFNSDLISSYSWPTPITKYAAIYVVKPDTGMSGWGIIGGNTSTGGTTTEMVAAVSNPTTADAWGGYTYPGFVNVMDTGLPTKNGLSFMLIQYNNSGNGSIDIKINGTTRFGGSSDLGGFSYDLNPFQFEIGGYTNGLQMKGYILEAIVVEDNPTDTEINQLYTYIENKYGTIVTPTSEPTAISSSQFFYSATGGSSYVNQGTSGFTATNGSNGSGSAAAISYVSGATPYWNIVTPSPQTHLVYINTNEDTAGNATDWTMLVLFQQPDLSKNRLPLTAFDSSTDRISAIAASTSTQMAAYYGDASSRVELFAPSGTVDSNKWILAVTKYDPSNFGRIYVNSTTALATNTTSKTINVINDFTVGQTTLGSTTVDNTMKIAAFGFWKTAITDQQIREFYNYYNYQYGLG